MQPHNDFERFWAVNKRRILEADEEYRRARDAYKMKTGTDWLLFGIPVAGAIVVFDYTPFKNELLNFLSVAALTIVLFVICVWIKSLMNNNRPLSEIEEDIKKKYKEELSGTSD